MAASNNDSSIAALYLELGLDLNQLETDLISADRTIQQNLSRLQNESTLIRLRSNVEINGLDEAADATRILEIREEALNRQMEIQRDRIRVTEAALQDLTNRRGADAAETQRTAIRLERERLALQRLQRELNGLRNTDAPEELANRYGNASERIRGSISNITDNAENFTSGLNGALETSLDLIDQIPSGYGKAIAAMVAATAAVPVMEFAIAGMARNAVDRFNEIEEKAYELHMTFEDTYKYLNTLEMAHAESDDLMGFIRGIDDAIAKGDVDDPETMALQKFGVALQDKTGRFLTYGEQLQNLYEGYLRAKQVGEEVEYLLFLNGESIHEILPLFERMEEAEKDAAQVEWADYNVAAMHEATREMKLLDNQVNEFGYSISAAITPLARAAIQDLFEKFRDGTKWINENKDTIAYWGFAALETIRTVSGAIDSLKEKFSDISATEVQFGDWGQNAQWKQLQQSFDESNKTIWGAAIDTLVNDLFGGIAQRAKETQEEYNKTVDELKDKTEELNKQWESNPLSYALRDSLQRAADLRDELEDLNLEIDFDEDEYGLSLAQVDTWIERELKNAVRLTQGLEKSYAEAVADGNEDMVNLLAGKMKVAKQEEEALYKLAAAKAEKIEQDKEHALEDIRDEAEANFKTDIENQIKAIDDKKDDWIHAGMEEAEATALAERLKADAIETANDEAVAKLSTIYQTSLEQRLAQIEKEKQAWIDKGVDEVKATQWAEQAKVDAQRNAAMSVLKSQLDEYRAFREGGYQGLMDFRLDELFKSGIRPEDLRMTPEMLAAFQKAQDTVERNLLPNFRTDYDRGEDNRLWNNMRVEQQRLQREELERIASGISIGGVQMELTPEIAADFGIASEEVLQKMYDPINHAAESFQTLIPQLDGTTEKIGELNSAITEFSATEQPAVNLPETPTSVMPNEPVGVETPTIPPIDTSQISAAFESLVSPMEEVSTQFAELTNQLIETTSSLSDLVSALNNLQLPNQNQSSAQQTSSAPPNITVTVSIEEAHAWDSQHIQELADKVADNITPAITNAIGGDSNRY